jgi:hypothetical protein
MTHSVCTTALRVIVSWPAADMQLDTVHVCCRYTMLLYRPVTDKYGHNRISWAGSVLACDAC